MANFDNRYPCPLCSKLHAIRDCTRFLALDIERRREKVEALNLCKNCLAQSHRRKDCPSEVTCLRCRRNHNSLLHLMDPGNVWFPMTAMVRLYPTRDASNKEIRIVIDPSRRYSAITLEAAERCRCELNRGYTSFRLRHRLFDRDMVHVRCVVEDTRYGTTPSAQLDTEWTQKHPVVGRANLADNNWHIPYLYHMVLGADVASQVFIGNTMGRAGQTLIQFTSFGPAFFGEGRRSQELRHDRRCDKK
ncbi:uncharacterized protein LOC142242424 [Haematobia irritans]|uniref:uncharacterized protein LOC142229565 n=1 Tax=Haematobia irritans TaxID=7368 RepID=UPI003F50276D